MIANERLAVDPSEVFRMMGYPADRSPTEPVRALCLEQIRLLDRLIDPWGGSREVGIEAIGRDWVRLASGRTLRSRRLAQILRRATSVQVCLVTVGPRVGEEINRCMAAGDMIGAMALDAAASAAASGAMERLRARVCSEARQRDCGTTLPYGPGYASWSIRDTPVLFSCLEEATLPVRLNEQLMMVPAKSLLGVIGLAPGARYTPRAADPCRLCDLEHCSVRRSPNRTGRDR